PLVERIALADSGASDKSGRVGLRRGIIALAIARRAHPSRELACGRPEFRRDLRVLFPLAGAHDCLRALAERRGEAVDARGDAAEHRDVEVGGDHHAHKGDILCKAARGGKGVDAVAFERRQQSRERVVAVEITPVLEPHAYAAPARATLLASLLKPAANV